MVKLIDKILHKLFRSRLKTYLVNRFAVYAGEQYREIYDWVYPAPVWKWKKMLFSIRCGMDKQVSDAKDVYEFLTQKKPWPTCNSECKSLYIKKKKRI